ncbi:ATP-binding protein, partial [uncultured Methanobrevibacter sp.]|uniref:ATP-binding protein n=1 Tax=uncultured Methanobrevibacter sp. TaxID=253161 RepID=UPI002638143D
NYEYPFEAIREALVNALAHRDYTIQTASITFYIYPDRIEIKSPGRLVYPLKVSELEENKPIHRNETLSRIFSKTIYMEHVGTGIKRMKDEMKRFGLEEPEFMESGEFFKVIFRNNVNGILNDRQRIFLKSNINEITTQEYMDMFEISRNTTVKDLNQLIDGKYIELTDYKKQINYSFLMNLNFSSNIANSDYFASIGNRDIEDTCYLGTCIIYFKKKDSVKKMSQEEFIDFKKDFEEFKKDLENSKPIFEDDFLEFSDFDNLLEKDNGLENEIDSLIFEESSSNQFPEIALETDDILMKLIIKKDYSKIKDIKNRKKEFFKDLKLFIEEFEASGESDDLMEFYEK